MITVEIEISSIAGLIKELNLNAELAVIKVNGEEIKVINE